MPLFKSLFPLARDSALTVLIVAEGEQLRVNVMPKSKDEKSSKTLYPLSLLGSPEELDRDFAQAVEIYTPGSQSVLEQAQAASAANGNKAPAPALPAPTGKKRGPKPKNASLPAPDAPAGDPPAEDDGNTDENGDTPPEVDPRQTQIPGLDETVSEQPAEPESDPVPVTGNEANVAQGDEGLDIL
jgi:PRTRC genetic system protein E